jgi:hypothetical protein
MKRRRVLQGAIAIDRQSKKIGRSPTFLRSLSGKALCSYSGSTAICSDFGALRSPAPPKT